VITFAGRRWRIEAIDHRKRLVDLVASGMGKLPRTGGNGLPVHERVRQQMRQVLAASDVPDWLDATARSLLLDAQRQYQLLRLDEQWCVVDGTAIYLFLWQGDLVQDALAVLLRHQGLAASSAGVCIRVTNTIFETVAAVLSQIGQQRCPMPNQLLIRRDIHDLEKWDRVLPDDLFFESYASRALALQAAHSLCSDIGINALHPNSGNNS